MEQTLTLRRQALYLWDLLYELVLRDMKLRYKRSILGIVWSLLNPLFHLLILVFLFRRAISLDIPNYPAFAFTGVLAYTWFQSALYMATGAITDNRDLIRRPHFPAAILPVVIVTTNLIHFLLALPILFVFVVISGITITDALLALPLVITLEFLLILGLGYLSATLQVTLRDTQHLVGVILRLMYFLTPVFYTVSFIPEQYRWIYRFNPMAQLIAAYRKILLEGNPPSGSTMLILSIFMVALVGLGYKVFMRASYRFVDEL